MREFIEKNSIVCMKFRTFSARNSIAFKFQNLVRQIYYHINLSYTFPSHSTIVLFGLSFLVTIFAGEEADQVS